MQRFSVEFSLKLVELIVGSMVELSEFVELPVLAICASYYTIKLLAEVYLFGNYDLFFWVLDVTGGVNYWAFCCTSNMSGSFHYCAINI